MNHILIFGGTTEGRLAAGQLSRAGLAVTVSVATDVGAEVLSGLSSVRVLVGRRDRAEMVRMLEGVRLCIDATHPYASEASRSISAACRERGVPCYRLLRGPGAADHAHTFQTAEEICWFLSHETGNILLTTGSKSLTAYGDLDRERLYVRVLPTHEALAACEALGLPHSHIIAMQGPFSREMNLALLRQFQIRWLVSKDGGGPGGWAEKREAAREAGAELLLLARPAETGLDYDTLIQEVLRQCKEASP